ncbi:HD domain-containing protein [Candidatus Bipolaricaulota bacterium]|nr:HD domain-containing protein [Candidatus Bipolaricaulota bacterium]
MRDKLLSILPEIEWIGDADLREKVIATWIDGLERGGWTPEDVARMPFTLAKKVSASFAQHVRSVTRVCAAVSDIFDEIYGGVDLKLDRDMLLAGALLHDVGKLVEMEEANGAFRKTAAGKLVRHAFSGVALADAHDVPAAVQHIIGTHSKEGDPFKRIPESIICHFADFMNFDPIEG